MAPSKFSRYMHFLKREDQAVVFHELHPNPLYLPRAVWESIFQKLSRADDKTLDRLASRKLIVRSSEEDDAEYQASVSLFESKKINPFILYLVMARGCNFACSYCPVPERPKSHQGELLSLKNAIAGINKWVEHVADISSPRSEYWIILYGGEPLLNRGLLRPVLEYLESLIRVGKLPGKDLRIMLSTNGALVDSEVAKLCQRHKVIVAIGIDGFEDANNAVRRDRFGNGTFSQVVSSIDLLISHGVTTCASIMLTPWNLESMPEFLLFLRDKGVSKVGFNFSKGKFLKKLIKDMDPRDFYHKASRCVIESSRGIGPNFEFQIQKKHRAFFSKQYFPLDCTCYGNQLVVQPDGQITNCPFFGKDLGHVENLPSGFRIWNHPTVSSWRKRTPLYSKAYERFPARSLCGGGCAWSSFEKHGDLLATDEAEMIFAQEVLKEFLWSKSHGS